MKSHLALEHGLADVSSGNWRQQLRPVSMLGVTAWWSATFDRAEMARRGGAQFTCLRRLDVVDALLNLPVGCPVARGSLSTRERRVLMGLPMGVLGRAAGDVVRLVTTPLRVDHAVVCARSFRRGLEAASSFSTYCARSVVFTARAEPDPMELTEASFYGVGVYVSRGGRLSELVAPEPLPAWSETPASWVFSETLADRLVQRG
jgi:hypothetical protein